MYKCYICDNECDVVCESCGEPVCADCCVPFTLHNQIDYTLCDKCNDDNLQQFAEDKYEDDLFDELGPKKYRIHKKKQIRLNLICKEINEQLNDKS